MNRIARVTAATALFAALGCGIFATAFAAGAGAVHLSYARMFGLDAGRGSFTLLAEASLPGASIVSAAVFGVDAQLPAGPPRPIGSGVAFVRLPQLQNRAFFTDDIVFRLHEARLQVAYARPQTAGLRTPRPAYAAPVAAADFMTVQAPAVTASPFATTAVGAYVPARADATSFDVPTNSSGVRIHGRFGTVRFEQSVNATRTDAVQSDAFAALQQCGESEPSITCPANSLARVRGVALSTGTSFGVRAGNRRVRVSFTGGVEHLVHAEDVSVPNLATIADPTVANAPQLVDLTKAQLGASLAVPVTGKVTVGAGYNSQHFAGAYGASLNTAIDARKNQYLGNITYQVNPKAAITFSARQSQYRDSYVPSFNFVQRQASLNVTVKF